MPVADRSTSTKYSKQRFAHPFFLPAPPEERQPIDGMVRMLDWSKKQLGPLVLPKATRLSNLADVIGKDGVSEIDATGEIRFHALGDTGVNHATEAQAIALEMKGDFHPGAGGLNPAFLFHLGDVVYGPDKTNHYGERFYSPYRDYPGKIIAIPGNHDGEVTNNADKPSLKAFVENFCAAKAVVPIQASGSGIFRETMTQPGAFWLLDAPFVRIVGLYSNLLENPGYLHGIDDKGKTDNSQIDWLNTTLGKIAKKPKKALIVATHHPPYSQSGHSGSDEMNATIDDACKKAGLTPDAFLSGHAHNYQRYTRRMNGKQVPYIVAGTGGIGTQKVAEATGQPIDTDSQVTYEVSIQSHGYLMVSVSADQLRIEFWEPDPPHNKFSDSVLVDLKTGKIQ